MKTNYVDELIEMMIHNEVDFIFVIDRPLYHKRMGKTLYEKRRNFIFAHYENDLVKKGESKHTRNIKTTFYINRKRISYRKRIRRICAKNAIDFKTVFRNRRY